MTATVSAAGVPLDVRRVTVDGLPTDRVVDETIAFDGTCRSDATPSDAGAPAPCSPSGACRPACELSWPPLDDAASPKPADAGEDADATSVVPEAAAPDASPAVCAPGATRCDGNGNGPEVCVADDAGVAAWVAAVPCVEGTSHCVSGSCEPVPPSCQGLHGGARYDCGWLMTSDCCSASDVPGGTFVRGYDDAGYDDASPAAVATVSAFRLDTYEVTVGRFAQFVAAVSGSPPWVPPAGSGVHVEVDGGSGLANASDAGPPNETGWDTSWNENLASSPSEWSADLLCDPNAFATWGVTPPARTEEELRVPINCVSWYDAYAFCIWDGGFLPSDAEWNFAASGGDEQRRYPWGAEDPGMNTSLAMYDCLFGATGGPMACMSSANIAPVGQVLDAGGIGRWGQADLAGNLAEWTLDAFQPYSPCVDCAALDDVAGRVVRGGAYDSVAPMLLASQRSAYPTAGRSSELGFRCARQP